MGAEIENVLIDPFDGEIFYGEDELGDNVYFRIIALFEYEGKGYDVYSYTTDPESAYIGEVFEIEEKEKPDLYTFMSVPLEMDQTFYAIRDAWNRYAETCEELDLIDEEDDE